MPDVPAFCDTCGAAFPSGFFAEDASFSLSNFIAGPCPKCGGMGHVPDGLYNIVGNSINILANSRRSSSELIRIAERLRSAKQRNATPDEISATLKEELPELSSVADTIPKTRAELYAFITVILTIIGMIVTSLSGKESPKIEVHQVITNITESPDANNNRKVSTPLPATRGKKVGRNEPCPCGSGRKYKKCCGS
jgi:hypothetical protein